MDFEFSFLSKDDIEAAAALADRDERPHLANDVRRMLKLSAQACVAIRTAGRLVGTLSLVPYGTRTGVGSLLLNAAQRSAPLEEAILRKFIALARERGLRRFGLDVRLPKSSIFKSLGFREFALITKWRGVLVQGVPGGAGTGVFKVEQLKPSLSRDVLAYDKTHCGEDRRLLLSMILSEPDAIGWQLRSRGALRGFAILRSDGPSLHLGPLMAQEEDGLRTLLAVAAVHASGHPVEIDSFCSLRIQDVFRDCGLKECWEGVRMTYRFPKHLLSGNPLPSRFLMSPPSPMVATTCFHLG